MASPHAMQTPPFLTKLYQLVNDPATASLVSWTDAEGLSFTVYKPSEFGRDILPKYFKHNNFSSFVRQLNQYGFHKQNPDRWMFGHDSFRKSRPDLLKNITRRRPKQPPISSAVLPRTLSRQAVVELGNYDVEGEVKSLKRHKDILIKELVVTRQKEDQLKNRCDTLESRVSNLENSSKQMQAFIMHYFSQALQPYSDVVASRKRKRLPASSAPDHMDMLVERDPNQVSALSPPAASVDALRVMMQQMGVGMTHSSAPTHPPGPQRPAIAAPDPPTSNPIVEPSSHSPKSVAFPPATIQELPLEDANLSMNGFSSSKPPTHQQTAIAPPTPTFLSADKHPTSIPQIVPPNSSALNGSPSTSNDLSLQFLEDLPSTPSNGLNDKSFSPSDFEISFDASHSVPDAGDEHDERTIEDFLALSSDDAPLPPPLTHLPEGTDIHELAQRIESFSEQGTAL